MRNRPVAWLAIIVAVLVLGSLVYMAKSPRKQAQVAKSGEGADRSTSNGGTSVTEPGSGQPPATKSPDSAEITIDGLFARLQAGEATDADLEALRRALLNAPPQQSIAAIRAFLESGRDIATRQEFMIAEGGVLSGAPTMRTFLLDILGQISRKTKSDAAAVVSRKILETKESSDEWAVAMRNVGWHDPAAKPYLAGKAREMLTHEPWVLQPSAGFLESFDVIVYSGDPAFIPNLTALLRGESEELRRASAVALDRLSAMAPLEVMNYLNANPNELADRPFLRADYYAKADLGNPKQIQALEAYLARGDVSLPEKTKLLQGLATPASFVSENLLTPSPSPDADDSPLRDQQLTQTLDQWIKQNRYPELQSEMAEIRQRLGM